MKSNFFVYILVNLFIGFFLIPVTSYMFFLDEINKSTLIRAQSKLIEESVKHIFQLEIRDNSLALNPFIDKSGS